MGTVHYTKADGTEVNKPSISKSPIPQQGDVIITGAGFSKAITDKAPTMNEFLEYALHEGYYGPENAHSELGKAVKYYYGDKKGIYPNIEELATFLDSSLTEQFQLINQNLAYEQLLEVIKRTLFSVWESAKSADNFSLYKHLSNDCVEKKIPIITFNYDLLLDNLLYQTGKWNPLHGYGSEIKITFQQNLMNHNILKNSQHIIGQENNTYLLKMHGSLNWGIRNVVHPDGTNPIEINLSISPSSMPNGPNPITHIKPIENTTVGFSNPVNANYTYKPLIIPPLTNKNSSYKHPFIEHTWYLAFQALWKAKRIFIIGYSMPDGDYEVKNLLIKSLIAFSSDEIEKPIFLINPDENVKNRINSLKIGIDSHHVFKDCIKWLQTIYS